MNYLEKAHDFVENEKPFHLGFLPTEQSNPQTRGLDKVFETSENYKMEKPMRGFEGEFAESMAAMKVLEGMMEGGCAG